jgi:prepilin-type N-terminal cleavage/methylation domain-containing protein/prepilin-type processing-associated H-X9-DG protein
MEQHKLCSKKGFTLIELLVTIGVITLLVGILLPALSKSHQKARQVACLSNLRQLGVAFIMYENDNKNQTPRSGQNTITCYSDINKFQPSRDVTTSALYQYVGPSFTRVFVCPEDDPSEHHQFSSTNNLYWNSSEEPDFPFDRIPNLNYSYPGSYSFNERICTTLHRGRTLKYNKIKTPSVKILIIDEDKDTIDDASWAWPDQYGLGGNIPAIRHRNKKGDPTNYYIGYTNVCFADGHAGEIKRADCFDPNHYDPLVVGK